MNAAGEVLEALASIGATIRPAGDRLVLRAGEIGVPGSLIKRIRQAKGDLLAVLAVRNARLVDEPPRRVFDKRPSEADIINWLNHHPAPSPPGRCVWCGIPEAPAAVVVPFGTEPGMHTWLHSECWPAWHEARRAYAMAGLHVLLEPDRADIQDETYCRPTALINMGVQDSSRAL
jgi:hypothetical protein